MNKEVISEIKEENNIPINIEPKKDVSQLFSYIDFGIEEKPKDISSENSEDIDKGLLDMINKGLIPKCSDVTPAFNRDGNPFSITSTNFNKFSLLRSTLTNGNLISTTTTLESTPTNSITTINGLAFSYDSSSQFYISLIDKFN